MIDRPIDRLLLDPATANPFADPVARLDVHVAPPPDVETIHGAVRAELRRAIGAAGGDGRAQMVLVTGDPGMGKTHELLCLQVEAQRAQRGFYFIDVPPLKDAGAPFHHVLRNAVQGLAGQGQLMRLLWESLRRVATSLRAAAWRDGDEQLVERLDDVLIGGAHMVDAFAAMIQGDRALADLLFRRGRALAPLSSLSAELGRVLCKLPDPDAQAPIVEWLRAADLPDDDLQLLGVKTSLDSEARCFETLQGLLKLCPTPVAMCFDQLEATSAFLGLDGFVVLFNALMEIYQQLPVCIVLMCQSQQWAELHGRLPRAAIERVRVLPPLARPTGEQAVRLVASRLAPFYAAARVTPPYPSYPFSPVYLEGHTRKLRPTLRQVLLDCGEQIEAMRRRGSLSEPSVSEPAPAPASAPRPGELLHRAHAALAASIDDRSELKDPPQRQERLRSAIARLLAAMADRGRALGKWRVSGISVPAQPTRGVRAPMVVTLDGNRRVALEVYNDKPVYFAVQRLLKVVTDRGADGWVLVREREAPIGEAPKTREALATGKLAWVDRDVVRRLVAAELLLDAVAAGEVSIGERAATVEEALAHLVAQDDMATALAPAL